MVDTEAMAVYPGVTSWDTEAVGEVGQGNVFYPSFDDFLPNGVWDEEGSWVTLETGNNGWSAFRLVRNGWFCSTRAWEERITDGRI